MLQDRLKWNEKFKTEGYPDEPATIVKEYAKLAAGTKALDIAAGNGRNALFLAKQGFTVDAVDLADAGLKLFAGKHPNIQPICADLDNFDIAARHYDLIINIKYLNRRLFPYILEGLAPGGILIFQTFLDSPKQGKGQAARRDYRLRQNELIEAFLALRILLYKEFEEKKNDEAVYLAALVGIKIG